MDGLCGGCGEPRDEAWDPASEGTYEAEILRCHSCTARAQKAATFAEQSPSNAGALKVVSHRTADTSKGVTRG